MCVRACGVGVKMKQLTDFAYNLVVLQHAPSNIHAVVIPVGARHLLVDICIDTRHCSRPVGHSAKRTGRDRYGVGRDLCFSAIDSMGRGKIVVQ